MTSDAVTVTVAAAARPPALRQWWALTTRGLGSIVRNGEFILAFVSPAFLAICFYLPLRSMMNQTPGMDYAQFLMPIITLQSVAFVATSAAMRVAFDRANGINTRFRTLPMPLAVPGLARFAANMVLLVISLVCATIVCLVIGWRPDGGVGGTIALYAVSFGVGAALTVIADGAGVLASSPEATSQALTLPVLILGMLSTGFIPESKFPHWIGPFVRNQPVSHLAAAMRALNDGTATWAVVAPALYWTAGLLVFGLVLVVVGARRWDR